MTEHFITLSTTEPNNYVGLLKMRQGDINTQTIQATITANGQLFKFDRLSVFFNAVLPNGNVIRDKVTDVDYVNSKLNYVVADSFLQEVAQVTAWFSFENDEKIIDSTKNFQYSVIPGWKECIPQGNYIYELSEIQREIEEIISNKDFSSLLNKISLLETNISYLDNTKADKDEMNVKIKLLNDLKADKTLVDAQFASIVSGAPKGTFTTLNALKEAYPQGTEGVFLVLENGHWYYYASGWKDGGVYQATVSTANEIGSVLYGLITINRLQKSIVISKGTTVTTVSARYNIAQSEDITLNYTSDSPSVWLVYDPSGKNIFIEYDTTMYQSKKLIVIAQIFNGQVFFPRKSRIQVYPLADFTNNVSLSYINWGKQIKIDTNAKTITIPSGMTAIDSRSGFYYRNADEKVVNYSNVTIGDGIALVSLYLRPSLIPMATGNYDVDIYYADYTPQNPEDIKVFSIYNKKIYGVDEITKNQITVNSIKNGGWGEDDNSIRFKYQSLDEWFSYVAAEKTSKIMWLGDSTWAGYTGHVNGSTTPFPMLIQTKLDEYFGKGKVTSINNSIGGESIVGMVNRLEGYLQDNPNTDVLFIGCGLNYIFATSTENRRSAFETAINLCLKYNVMPVICTAQAHQVPNTETGDDWTDRSQFATTKYDLPLRLGIAQKYGLNVIDYTKFTQKILDNAPEPIGSLVEDGLHGSAIMHSYERDFTFAEIVPTVIKITKASIVPIYDQRVFAGKSLRYVKDITMDSDGFKSQWQYTATQADVIYDAWIFLDATQANWSILAVGNDNIEMSINGTATTKSVTNKKIGLYHVVVKSTIGDVIFKGLKIV